MPSKKPNLETLEAANSDVPPIGIPPGARVRVDFEAPVSTDNLSKPANESRYPNDLAELADEMDSLLPADPLTDFCEQWYQYSGYNLRVTRLPDSAARRVPGQTYHRTCLEIESLGDIPFDPVNIQSTLQLINGNSGGIFRLWLIDERGRPIPEAHLPRVVIGDPPKHHLPPFAPASAPAPAPARETSDIEKRFQAMQEKLLENAMMRILEPSSPPPPPAASLSDEDRLTLLLVREGGLLPNVISKLSTLAGAPEAAAQKQTWSDWLRDVGGELLRTNPEIAERITATTSNLVSTILDRLPLTRSSQTQPQQPTQPIPQPVPQLAPQQALQPTTDLDNDTMAIIDDLFALLTGTDKLVANHPVFLALAQDYPAIFPNIIQLIATQPLDSIVSWLQEQSPLYDSLLTGPSAEHYRQRLSELQALARQPVSTTNDSN